MRPSLASRAVIAPGVRSCARESSAIVMPALVRLREQSILARRPRPAGIGAPAGRQGTERIDRCADHAQEVGAMRRVIGRQRRAGRGFDAIAPARELSNQVFAFHGSSVAAPARLPARDHQRAAEPPRRAFGRSAERPAGRAMRAAWESPARRVQSNALISRAKGGAPPRATPPAQAMTVNDIRRRFIDFFVSKGHTHVPSSRRSCPATTRRCCSRTPGWCSSRTCSSGTTSGRTRARRRRSAACAPAASTTTSRTWATRRGTTRSSRCWATSASATTSSATRSATPGSC